MTLTFFTGLSLSPGVTLYLNFQIPDIPLYSWKARLRLKVTTPENGLFASKTGDLLITGFRKFP